MLREHSEALAKIQELSWKLDNSDSRDFPIDLINLTYGKLNTLLEFGIIDMDQYEDLTDFMISKPRLLKKELWNKTNFQIIDSIIEYSYFVVDELAKFENKIESYDIVETLRNNEKLLK